MMAPCTMKIVRQIILQSFTLFLQQLKLYHITSKTLILPYFILNNMVVKLDAMLLLCRLEHNLLLNSVQSPAQNNRRRVSSVVEYSSANPKVPGSIPGPVSYRGYGL